MLKDHDIQPNNKAVLYDIAMIQQKSAEMLFGSRTTKRTLKDLKRLFASLTPDKAPMVPRKVATREIAEQRRKYGDNMLRKSEEHLATQKQRRRQKEWDRHGALERERLAELREEAGALAAQRKHVREQAMEWSRMESDEKKERKPKKAPKQKADGTGDAA
ncbi:hypothetical protein B0H15DRAFT_799778 [Mycena belliarum]|uniref:Uncharacterized protein n=1 Tax=Mycena belliarum TaxID=1033014 RepID=A0AAD6U6N5_9AGAR|nr:hypothetical protein B0H15DRAFT_799778 [Mycena belliae]